MRKIALSRGEYALVSDQDYERVSAHKWSLSHSPSHSDKMYAVTKIGGKQTGMHRFIMQTKAGLFVDHADGNGLNNTRENLRECTRGQNRANSVSSRALPKGVYSRNQRSGAVVFRARIRVNGKTISLGTFSNQHEASKAYAKAAKLVHKEFARP